MSEEFIIDVKNLTKFFIKDGVKVGIFLAILRSAIPAFYRNKLFAKKNKCYALRNVNFKAATGEAIGVVGVNGSGKSTLMQIIAGTMQASDGRVNVTGRISAILELGSAFSPDFTGIENVRLNLTLLGIKSSDLEYKMKEAIEFADIGNFIDSPIKVYSSGMLMRLAFAVQVVSNPELLIIDEALAVGDECFQHKCFDKIKKLKLNGTTIVLVSHSSDAILSLCDRALMLKDGKVFVIGSTKNVITIYHKSFLDKEVNEEELLEEFELLEKEIKTNNKSIVDKNAQWRKSSPISSRQTNNSFNDPTIASPPVVQYSNDDIQITNCKILNRDGLGVNNLVNGEYYTFEYQVRLKRTIEAISFGCMFKLINGNEISGINTSKIINQLNGNEDFNFFNLRFEFECVLLPNVYTINAGIIESKNGVHKFAARSVDVIIFKVIPWMENQEKGLVSMFRQVSVDAHVVD